MDWKKNKHVIIPEGTNLSERMFQNNNIVETITLPDDITFLPDYFCFNCKNLKAIFGGHNVKIISNNTFENSTQLHHLDFIPQIGYPIYNRLTKKYSLHIVRELEISDFSNTYGKKQFGYILHKQKDECIIWNINAKKYVHAIINADIPLYCYVEFSYKYSITYDTNKHQLDIERNLVDNVRLANDEDVEKFIYADDAKQYINGSFSYIKKINAMNAVILRYVNSLNIEEIIESYTVSINEVIRTKIGGDDTYILTETAHSNANWSDIYLKKLLPSYCNTTEERGYCTFSHMSNIEKELYKDKEKSVKFDAKCRYSKEEHITSLIDAYIKYLYHRTNIYQDLDATNFLSNNRKYIFTLWGIDDSLYWDDISKFTFELNNKLNSRI